MRLTMPRRSLLAAALALGASAVAGCQQESTPDVPLPNMNPAPGAAAPADGVGQRISQVMNETTAKYRPLEYEYDENLLTILDRVETRLAGKSDKLDPLPMPKLDEAEQLDHFREVIRRWTAKTGKELRATLDPLRAEVAARKPGGPAFHPDFHKKFAEAFDDFIPIEVAEIRERRNKALHDAAKPLLDEFRARDPEGVKQAETTLNTPPYNITTVGAKPASDAAKVTP